MTGTIQEHLQPSVVVPDPPPVQSQTAVAAGTFFDLHYFQQYPACDLHWCYHNAVLKYFRRALVESGKDFYEFHNREPERVPLIEHGMATEHTFSSTVKFPWCWQQMVGGLSDFSLR